MKNPVEQFVATNKAHLEAFEGSLDQAYAGMEKLVELNLAATKAAMGESFGHAKAVMAAKTPQELMTLQTRFFQPLAEKSVAYFQHVQSITTESSVGFTQQVEANLAEAQKAFGASMDQMAKNAPVGSEAAVAAFQNALSNSHKAIESAQATIKKAAESAQANFAAAAKKAAKV